MTRQLKRSDAVRMSLTSALLVCGLTLIADTTAIAKVSKRDSGSLTTYQAGVSLVQGVRPLPEQRSMMIDGMSPGTSTGSTPNEGCGGGGCGSGGTLGGASFQGACGDLLCWCQRGGSGSGSIGNPGGSPAVTVEPSMLGGGPSRSLNGIDLLTGVFSEGQVDALLPQMGTSAWHSGRSYNPRQKDGGSYITSGGAQGKNFFNGSQKEIRLYEGTTDADDLIYLVLGSGHYAQFKRVANSPTSNFEGVNGSWGAVSKTAAAGGEPESYTLTDLTGTQYVFFGFDNNASTSKGQIWKIIDPTGSTSYIGHASTGSTAITDGYSSGRITKAYDAQDRRYTYTYTSNQLTEVKVETKTGGTWASPTGVATVWTSTFTYYENSDTYGDDGDLELVTVSVPLSDGTTQIVGKTLYRYWQGTYDATTNPGNPHDIQYIYRAEGIRRTGLSDANLLTASEATLKPYASAYFKYDSVHRIKEAWFNGACGCSGAAAGSYVISYQDSYSGGQSIPWNTRTIVKFPANDDSTHKWMTYQFDSNGLPLSTVITDGDPAGDPAPNFWATVVVRDSDGFVTEIATPENVTAYVHTDGLFTRSTSAGLITAYSRIASGDLKGMIQHIKHKKGTSGTAYLTSSQFYTSKTKTIGDVDLVRPLISGKTIYTTQTTTEDAGPGNSPPSGAYRTEFTYTYYDGGGEPVLPIKEITTTYPVVITGNNGSGSATTSKQRFRLDGTPDLAKSADGIITYTKFEAGIGSSTMTRIVDADTTQTSSGQDLFGVTITGYDATSPSSAFHLKSLSSHDAVGRSSVDTKQASRSATIEDEHSTYVSKLTDGRVVTLQYAKYESGGTPKYYGPVQFRVTNLAGNVEAQGTIALDDNSGEYTTDAQSNHVDETKSDPLLAIDWTSRIGTVVRYSTNIYDNSGGQLTESRVYFSIPSSGAGTEGTHYDATRYGYDNLGHRWRVKSPDGTIRRTVYDKIGRTQEQWIGTNDYGLTGGEASGTNNMVKIEALEYDSGNAKANSRVTKRTAYIQDSDTGKRETTYLYDFRGRMIVQIPPTAPYTVNKYDHAGRMIATAMYSSSSGLDADDDPTSLATNRMSLSQSFYDELGRVWKAQRHKIDASDGSDDDNLQTLTWFDAAGRVIKVDGSQLTKTAYDRLGRAIHQYVLASDNDTAYADADDVTGDIVLTQSDTTYDASSGLVLMNATIERFHDDIGGSQTTGALDTNADTDDLKYTATNVKGRIQITANWYDSIDRVVDTVHYGTYGGSDFDRDGLSVPARSDTALRTTYVFNPDGSMLSVTDPKGLVTRYAHDAMGRQVTVINNYVNGTPSGGTGDDDVHTRYAYTNGHKTKMHVDIDGDGTEDSDDQVTNWTYGVTKGASAGDSKIGSGSLLLKVIYPPQSGGQSEADRRVSYAYNAQGQVIWQKEHELNVFEFDYDTGGRQTHKRLTTLDGSFDNSVLRISTTYDSLGRRQLVTQYSSETVGSGTLRDEVKFSYDGWGNIEKFQQDNNSAVGAGGGAADEYDVHYVYAKATGGRNTIRRTQMVIASSRNDAATITYEYSSTGGLHDDSASRTTRVVKSTVTLAEYDYNGAGSVVGIEYPEPDVFNNRFRSTSGTYDDLDRFNRVIGDVWWKDLSTDIAFFDIDITYDRNSNITVVEDNVFTPSISSGFDAQYTMDNMNRLTKDEQGNWTGSAITSRSRQQIWTLDQVGNWNINRVDRNGDNDFIDTSPPEVDDQRTHNVVNEITDRDLDTDGDAAYDDTHYDLVYNKRGDMTDDAQNYEYVYDGFGRLRQVKNTSNQALVSEYWYNGLGHRRSWKYDTDVDGDVDGNDLTFHFGYDERWRIVATYRGSDGDGIGPKEIFVYHCAGADGQGGSSYIDAVAVREVDNQAWTDETRGVAWRDYYCQNWRADVVAMVSDTGAMKGWVKYSAYGVPHGIPVADTNGDGTVNSTDTTRISTTWAGTGNGVTYPTGDTNLDGNINATDSTTATAQSGVTLGWGVLSQGHAAGGGAPSGNRKGYAGYEFDPVLAGNLWHVRHRVLMSDLGRWSRRDPLGYVDGPHFDVYVKSNPTYMNDSHGTQCNPPCPPGRTCVCILGGTCSCQIQTADDCMLRYNACKSACNRGLASDTGVCALYVIACEALCVTGCWILSGGTGFPACLLGCQYGCALVLIGCEGYAFGVYTSCTDQCFMKYVGCMFSIPGERPPSGWPEM